MDPEKTHPDPPSQTAASGDVIAVEAFNRFLRFSHIYSSVVREIMEEKLLRETTALPLTLSQFHLLKLMTLNGHHQAGELAEFLGVSAPAVTKNIDKLERFGLVMRTPSAEDRRAVILSPSRRGRHLVEEYEALKKSRLEPILDDFTSEEIEQFADLLERFSVALLTRERTGRGFCLRCAAYIETGCPVGHVRGVCPYDRLKEESPNGDEQST